MLPIVLLGFIGSYVAYVSDMVNFYEACFAVSLLLTIAAFVLVSGDQKSTEASAEFKAFQRSYLIAYYAAMAGDWLQGPYVYALYSSYGYSQDQIANLFVAGFGSSMIFGTFIGSLADKWGRKKMATVYCLIYIASCVTKHFKDYYVLMLGRLLGGMATSLLYSVFDSWMVSEHSARGFPEDLMKDTFSKAMVGNSIVAIASGVIAEFVASLAPLSEFGAGAYFGGFTAPFDVASMFLVFCFFRTSSWNENYGSFDPNAAGLSIESVQKAFITIMSNRAVLLIGIISSLFEGSMFTFVFMWTPILVELDPLPAGEKHPFGLIFATFMLCCMTGSSLFNLVSSKMKVENMVVTMLMVAGSALALPWLSSSAQIVYFSFLAFEVCVGIYWPAMGTIKGMNVPDSQRSAIYNIFRVPLNAIVLFVLKNDVAPQTTFLFVVVMLGSAWILQTTLVKILASSATAKEEVEMDANDATV